MFGHSTTLCMKGLTRSSVFLTFQEKVFGRFDVANKSWTVIFKLIVPDFSSIPNRILKVGFVLISFQKNLSKNFEFAKL